MVQPYRVDNPWNGVTQGFRLGNALRDDAAQQRAGSALAGGDYAGGANALLTSGDVTGGLRVQAVGEQRQAAAANAEKAKREATLQFTEEAAGRLAEIHRTTKDPTKTLAAFDQHFAPRFQELGETPEEIAQLRAGLASDADTTLMALGAGAAKELGYELRNAGDEVLVFKGGQLINRYRGKKTVNVAEGGALYEVGGEGGAAPEEPEAQPEPAPAAPATAQGVKAVVDRLVSSGARITSGKRSAADNTRVGGAKNSYHLSGHAYDIVPPPGMSMAQLEQQLRSTGVDFAELINEGDHVHVAWPRGNERPEGSYEVAATGDTPAPPTGGGGARLIVQRPKAPKEVEWTPDGKGLLINRNGDRKADPAFAGSPEAGKVTESERTAGFLSSRLADSLKNLTDINGRSPDAGKPGLMEAAAGALGDRVGPGAANIVRSADRQQVIANQLDILDAALTLGTGAAYTREQLENYRSTYFPVLTDKPETTAAKRQKLISLLNAAKIKAGRSAPPELDSAISAARLQFGGGKPEGGSLPEAARRALKEGQNTTFQNGQVWTMRGGKPTRVN